MTFSLPPVVKLAERLLVQIEQTVRHFSRYHKYAFGNDLRKVAMKVATTAHRAWRDRAKQSKWTQKLVRAIDLLKLTMQLGSQIRAFVSFAQFEALMQIAVDLGRQAGGWNRQQQMKHPKGQNARPHAGEQRPQILSTSDASPREAMS